MTTKQTVLSNLTATNSTFAIGGVSCFAGSFVVTESAVLRMTICAEKPAHRKLAKRYRLLYGDGASIN